MKSQPIPYGCLIAVCTNCRDEERKSCSGGDSGQIRKALKKKVEARGLKGRVRVSQSGCLGVCDEGPNIMIFPEGTWFSRVTLSDLEEIMSKVEEVLS